MQFFSGEVFVSWYKPPFCITERNRKPAKVPSLTLRYLLRYLKDPAQTDPTLVSVDSFCGARTATPTQLIDHYRRQAFELLRIRRSKRLRPRDGKEKKEFVDPYRKSSLG